MSATPLQSVFLPDEAATLAAGRLLAGLVQGGDLLNLLGNLGGGKTTLSRGLIQGLGHTGAVKSPTYTLVEPYELGALLVMHYDLYRLADPEELDYLGVRDFLDADTVTLVEWPQRAGKRLRGPDLTLTLDVEGTGRRLSWTPSTARGEQLAQAFQQGLARLK
jgi:tRNA threonylcarbamoyladenosine biosynthesis protein TsaE